MALINAEFLQFVIDFFKEVAQAKLDDKEISIDWYKKHFLNPSLSTDKIAIHSGLNKKTITNMYNSASKQIVIDAANEHYDTLYEAINNLIDTENEIDLTLTIKLGKVGIDLNMNESLIVINTLAVKRAALRGGLWSTAGKRVEKPLMKTLCKLYQVSEENYSVKYKGKAKKSISNFEREIDFYLNDTANNSFKCEVKLMGKGNPESADAVIARDSSIFIADKLSDMNKRQLDSLNVNWVELRSENGYTKFGNVLQVLGIEHKPLSLPLSENRLDSILEDVFK